MSVSLYRKYRSKSLDEIVGQRGVVKALKSALNAKTFHHAYLFTGPRGVGKTSIARILAFAITENQYEFDNLPVDIIEIDAASNRGIEEIRDLREKVKIAPVSSKYKVYIIDEVHMLTTPAFNALLKTLEEPPAHVVFILATTESQKLPETIISRTQKYNFSLASLEDVVDHLQKICHKESIKIERPALELIAVHSGGSMRDALSTLDHVRHLSKDIKLEDVRVNIGLPADSLLDNILKAVSEADAQKILHSLAESEKNNVAAASIANGLIQKIKHELQSSSLTVDLNNSARLIESLSEVESSTKPDIKLTVSLLNNLSKANDTYAKKVMPVVKAKPTIEPSINKTFDPVPKSNKELKDKTELKVQPETKRLLDDQGWHEFLENIRSTHNTIYSVLRMAEIDLSQISKGTLALKFEFPFHKKRINEQRNAELIRSRLADLGFGDLKIDCKLSDLNNKFEPNDISNDTDNDVLGNIRNVFGSAEVME